MLKFPAQDAIQIYVSEAGFIVFKSDSNLFSEENIVCLTIGQFRSAIKHADELIALAEENKANWKAEEND